MLGVLHNNFNNVTKLLRKFGSDFRIAVKRPDRISLRLK
jgi:hypothetical protein